MLKPIEAGCLAVIIKSRRGNEGRKVVALSFVGSLWGFHGDDFWSVDFDGRGVDAFGYINPTGEGVAMRLAREVDLLRIDGFTEESKAEQAEKELVG